MTETASQQTAPVAIIGYGTAGVNALIALRSAGYTGPVSVFSNTDTLPYSPILTSYYAAGEKSLDECFPWTAEELVDLDATVYENCPVTMLNTQAHTIATAQGIFPYSKCVIATGATPAAFGFPRCDYTPFMLRTLDDAQSLKSALENPACKRVLVSGASMVALKTVEACLAQDKNVSLVGMNAHVLDMNALPQAAEKFEELLTGFGVQLRLGTTISAVENAPANSPAKLKVTFANGDSDFYDEICVSHGMRCNLGFVPPDALDIDRALLVDNFMRTSDPDVYAAGDVSQATELISGERRIVGIWKNAAVQGAVAGRAIAAELAGNAPDERDAFKGSISTNTITVKNALFISAGTIEITDARRVDVRNTNDLLVVYIYEGDRLVGFNLVSDSAEEGSVAFDTGAMLTLRIERGIRDCRKIN